jgi:hypothetical protein
VSAATPGGCILFFYAVDVAEAVNLPAVNDLLGGTTRTTPLVPRWTRRDSTQEREEILRQRMSYLAGDLLVAAWSAAFLFDGDAGAQSTLDMLEFANSQLLEFRYYDQRLDEDLTRIYADLQAARPYGTVVGRRYEHTAHQLHSLLTEVSELTERTENALKFIGDAHAARLFALVAARLGLSAWKASVRDKLEVLDRLRHPSCSHADHSCRPRIRCVHRARGDDAGDGVSGSSSAPAVRDSETRMVE